MSKQVREVLEYLLAHDEDGTFGSERFLCNRLGRMWDEGQIDGAAWKEAISFIEKKIRPFDTLSAYHDHHAERVTVGMLSVVDPRWPDIRRRYLREWIRELSTAEQK